MLPVAKRTHPNTHTLHLARVGWTNASLRCSDLHAPAIQFVEPIADLVEIEHDVSTVRYEKSTDQKRSEPAPVSYCDLLTLQSLNLLEQSEDVYNTAITNDTLRIGLNNANRHEVESNRLTLDNNGMTGICSACSTAAKIIAVKSV